MLMEKALAVATIVHAEHTLTKWGLYCVKNARQAKSSLTRVKQVAINVAKESLLLWKARAIAWSVYVEHTQIKWACRLARSAPQDNIKHQ